MATKFLRLMTASLGLVLCQAATGSAQGNFAQEMGLENTALGRRGIEMAISRVNRILTISKRFRHVNLRASWKEPGGSDNGIPLYWVSGRNLAASEIAFVPDNCRCIIMSRRGVNRFHNLYGGGNGKGIKVDKNYLVLVILLHEIGHVFHGHAGRRFRRGMSASTSLNREQTQEKTKEREADSFVGKLLREVQRARGTDFTRWSNAAWTVIAVGHLAMNLLRIRLIDNFGCTQLGCRRVFWDQGLSHPNFELRILYLQHDIGQNQTTAVLLRRFLSARRKSR